MPDVDQAIGDVVAAALELVEIGFAVVPAHCVCVDGSCSCGRADCASPGKHPRGDGWRERALRTPEAVIDYWRRVPDAQLGIATGQASGVVVIDVDGATGEATLAELEAKYGALPRTVTALTSRGRHLYFAAGDVPLHNRQGARGRGLGAGVDLRAEGGFVMVPPSRHPSGTCNYRWGAGPAVAPLATLPDFVVAFGREVVRADPPPPPLAAPRAGAGRVDKWVFGAIEKACAAVAAAPEGQRNHTLNAEAFNLGTIVAGGALDAATARQALLNAALRVKLGETEALKTIASGLAAGLKAEARTGPARDLPGYERTNGHTRAGAVASESYEPPGPAEPTVEPVPSAMVPRYNTAAIFGPLPTQRWAVPGLQLGPGRPTLIAGYGASGKTISVQALALAAAAGRAAWDRFECSPMVVLHIDYEQGMYATAKRYQRLALGMGIDPRELGNRLHYVELPRVYLDQRGGEDEYLRVCEGVDLVIVDALRGAAPHTDENDSAFRGAIDVLTWCSQQTRASMLVLHHAAKPRKDSSSDGRTVARGTSAIFDASGCVLTMAKVAGANLITQVKTPAEAEGLALDPFELVVEDVAIDGNPTAGARVTWRKPVVIDPNTAAENQFERDAAVLLRAVERVRGGGTTNQITARCGLGKQRALDVLHALAEEGRLIVAPGKGRTKIYTLPTGGQHE